MVVEEAGNTEFAELVKVASVVQVMWYFGFR
jgi:hypothetical protein